MGLFSNRSWSKNPEVSYGLFFFFFGAIYEWAGTTLLVFSKFHQSGSLPVMQADLASIPDPRPRQNSDLASIPDLDPFKTLT